MSIEVLKAILWLHGGLCRVMLKDGDKIIDTNEMWNNRCSAEYMVSKSVPNADSRFVVDASEIKLLNAEWDNYMETLKNGRNK